VATAVIPPTGNDGKTPIYEPNGRWTIFALAQMWTGNEGEGRYVPKVNDYVINYDTNECWRVAALNPTTLVPTLVKIKPISGSEPSEIDMLLGVGPGPQSQSMRAYLNDRVNPHTLTVDQKLSYKSSDIRHVKIYRGSQLDGTFRVVGLMYDQSGQLLGDEIQVKLAEKENGEVHAVWFIPSAFTREAMPNGEPLTIIAYGDNGIVVARDVVLVENTGYLPAQTQDTEYITDITLESPWLSTSDPTLIQFPMNVPYNSLNMIGVVHYNGGRTRRLPVDGTRFRMDGFTGYMSSQSGQQIDLVLQYALSSDEAAVNSSLGPNFVKSKSFRALTTKAEGQYTPKLYPVPKWIDAVNGYRLEWWCLNLDRNLFQNVTPYVRFNTNSPAFNPTGYGILQRLNVQINAKDINAGFKSVLHAQTVEVALLAQGTEETTNWTIGFNPNQNPHYGVNIAAISTLLEVDLWKVKIDQGKVTLDAWLDAVYWPTKPLYNPQKETAAPLPDWFALVVNGFETAFPISQWKSDLTVNRGVVHGDTILVKFFKRTPETDIILSVAPMAVHQSQ